MKLNKSLIAILTAGLVLASLVACGDGGNGADTLGPLDSTNDSFISIEGTDANGSVIYETIPMTPAETEKDIELNPTFVDKSLKVVVISERGTIRSSADMAEESKIAWPSEGTELTVTGESADWYRLSYGEGVAYITKAIVADASVLEGFTAVEKEEVTVTGDVNVRSYPSADSNYSIRGSLKAGSTVTRVAVSENWSRILFTVKVEVETGDPVEEVREYYIHNNYIKTAAAESEATAESTPEA